MSTKTLYQLLASVDFKPKHILATIFDDAGLLPPEGGNYLSALSESRISIFAKEGYQYEVIWHLLQQGFHSFRVACSPNSMSSQVVQYAASRVLHAPLLERLESMKGTGEGFESFFRRSHLLLAELGSWAADHFWSLAAEDMRRELKSTPPEADNGAEQTMMRMLDTVAAHSHPPPSTVSGPEMENMFTPKALRLLDVLSLTGNDRSHVSCATVVVGMLVYFMQHSTC